MSLINPACESEKPPTDGGSFYVPAGGGVTKWVSGSVYSMKATAAMTNGAFGFVEASVPAGGGPAPHVHKRADEAFYLLSGELEFLDGDSTYIARAGDFVFVPRGHRHRFKNIGIHTARLLFVFTPGGPERSFLQGGDDAQPGEPPPVWDAARFAQMQEVIDRFDLDTQMVLDTP